MVENLKVSQNVGNIILSIDKIDNAVKEQNEIYHNIIDRWEKIGLTEGLNGKQKEECAICFEKMASFLINEVSKKEVDENFTFETVAFPIIRRVLVGVGSFNGNFNPAEIEEYYYDNIENVKKETERLANERGKKLEGLDFVAEWSACLSDKLIEKLK